MPHTRLRLAAGTAVRRDMRNGPHLQRGSRVLETGTRRPRKENRKKSRRIPAKTSNKKMIIPVMRLIQATGAAKGRVSFPAWLSPSELRPASC